MPFQMFKRRPGVTPTGYRPDMIIRIKDGRAIVAAACSGSLKPSNELELQLQLIAWLVSKVSLELGVKEIEVVFDPDNPTDAVGYKDRQVEATAARWLCAERAQPGRPRRPWSSGALAAAAANAGWRCARRCATPAPRALRARVRSFFEISEQPD